MKDRLASLISEAEGLVNNDLPTVEQIADYLLANGVIVPPCSEPISRGHEKGGEWKKTTEPMGWHDVDCVECSACGESWVLDDSLDYDLTVEYWHFCPNCGARMKGV